MKRQLWLLGVAAISMFTGCSGDDEMSSPAGGTADGSGIGVNSNVEIRLSSKSEGTRSSLESDDNGLFEAEGLGIFCLAKGYLGVNPNEQPIDWTRTYPTNDHQGNPNYAVWLDNLEADAVFAYTDADGNTSDTPLATNIVWTDNETRWYPTGNWYNYQFYGYYPRVDDNDVWSNETQMGAIIRIDGTQDVIWGRTASADPLAYCAKYFRQDAGHAAEVPGMAFYHKLMRFTFTFAPGKDGRGSYESALTMGIDDIRIKQVPTIGNLVIADYAGTDDGKLTFDWNNSLADFPLLEEGDQPFANDHWTTLEYENDGTTVKYQPLGQGILLPVPESTDYRYLVQIVLKNKDGKTFLSEHPIELQSNASYEAGKSYNVRLTVNGPQEIYINATLEGWVLDDDTIHDVTL